ncbi:uncharacterized protein LOC111682254 isoform X1 [Lucilia cuprina]|uniref:uncharacterized protein LOC111682254 isoform X1 n=1 Tax=Lucilia cuprina TaxID=7375 RepID=UPI001F06DB7D|nr:uncharacterized protein LOC111682254 isoform X1 [Lucilia cuprina]XP_046801100.1 uncharacterized protein LOC111682254 isoform X1 [Lucilia cuprina]XP_046801101.1 uncharacterized protein LOC111682254 isoform X1 [Lucilia cuprina]XP_046801102.1 uncharacterized protein LOC111682254 isoform X1 [Lucilia cuprina]
MSNPNLDTVDHTQSLIQDKFMFDSDHLLSFCSNFSNSEIQDQTDSMLETKLEDLENRWTKLEISYERLMLAPISTASKDLKDSAKVNFNACSETFHTCRSNIMDMLKINRITPTSHNITSRMSLPLQAYPPQNSSVNIKLPPCDTEVFAGSYENWPSFRDMFTAIYINGTNCPPVVKLFHLRNKTRNEAGAIVKRYPLCDDSFDLAWNALKARYENKRVLVDHQLQILFNIPIATSEDSKTLQKIHSTVADVLQTLHTLNVNTENCDFFIVHLVCSKLPNETLALWEQSLKSHRELLKWSQLEEFLIDRYEAVERISNMKITKERLSLPDFSQSTIQSYSSQEKLNTSCKLCNEVHNLRTCKKFKRFTIQQRIDFVSANKICTNCLSPNHLKAKCPSKNTCFICKSNHHTSLHLAKPNNSEIQPISSNPPRYVSDSRNQGTSTNVKQIAISQNDSPSTSEQAQNSRTQVQANISVNSEFILLRTALVHILHMGELFKVRALIDSGSQRTFLSEKVRNRLLLPTRKSHVDVIGIGGQVQTATKECDLVLFAQKSNIKVSISAIILPKVTNHIPSVSFEFPKFKTENLDLADPTFNQSSQIDLILGNDSERFINIDGIKKNICGHVSAYNTIFGWVLSGPIKGRPIQSFTTSIVPSETSILNNLLRKFWEQEELLSPKLISEEDQYCETFYKNTTTRQQDGRYVVRLPFKKEFPCSLFLSTSRILALGQYSRMKISLSKDPELQTQYNAVLNEYLSLQHMEKTTFREVCIDDKYFSFYLPHHAVVRPEHKTTKV